MLNFMRAIAFLAFMAIGITLPAGAATKYTETFDSGANGWTASPTGISVGVRFIAAGIRVQFNHQTIPVPQVASISATGSASGGALTGDYLAAQVGTIGLSVIVSNFAPETLSLYLISRGSGYTHSISRQLTDQLLATGVWYTLAFSLQDAASGGWAEDPAGCFQSTLSDVDEVFMYIEKNASSTTNNAQRYMFDNFFLDGLPRATEFGSVSSETTLISWSDVRSNLTYHLQTATALGGGWSNVTSFTATGSSHSVSAPIVTNQPPAFFRLLQ